MRKNETIRDMHRRASETLMHLKTERSRDHSESRKKVVLLEYRRLAELARDVSRISRQNS